MAVTCSRTSKTSKGSIKNSSAKRYRRLSKTERAEIVEYLRDPNRPATGDLAARYNVTKTTINDIARKENLQKPRGRGKLSKTERAEIVDYLRDPNRPATRDLAARYNVTKNYINKIARKENFQKPRGPRGPSKTERAEIVEYLRDPNRPATGDLAARYNVSKTTINDIARKENLQKPRGKLSKTERAEIVDYLRDPNCPATRDLAARYNVTKTTINDIARKENLQKHHGPRGPSKTERAEIVEYLRDPNRPATGDLAARYNVSKTTINRILYADKKINTEEKRNAICDTDKNGEWIRNLTNPNFYYSELAKNITELQKRNASDQEQLEFQSEQEALWRNKIPMESMYPWPL